MNALRRLIKKKEKVQEERVADIKRTIKEDVKVKAGDDMRCAPLFTSWEFVRSALLTSSRRVF